VLTDVKMTPVDGMEVLKFGRLNFPQIPVVILTAFGSIEMAVGAMKKGAFDFLAKPVDHGQLLEVVRQALAGTQKKKRNLRELLGSSMAMNRVKKDIQLFAQTDFSVLIRGESGTGKELAARAIYNASERRNGPFIKINCAAIPKELIESELFGHKKGSFTGALRDRAGAFVKADKGVLFLDEIGDMPLELQTKLLHAVEEKTITPIGSSEIIPVSVKILSATNQDLESLIQASGFRSDLYYRLNTVSLTMPPLRDRPTDITELAHFFVRTFCKEIQKPKMNISGPAMDILIKYQWPGNVRELKNAMERAVVFSRQDTIILETLPEHIRQNEGELNSRQVPSDSLDIASQEQNLMLQALEQSGWNQSLAAKALGITRSALRYRLQKYGIKKRN
ncbi:MAG: sigma-54 dependent transcriptional regulator, partial [Desulfobacterales bacterium]|nr:sigma-54 dependent transcriptional regulator [Desulfobacterales bacterium]